jgi:hypothetical protein
MTKKQFSRWLDQKNACKDKRQRTTTQLCLLRFIKKIGVTAAYEQLITCISKGDRSQFDEIMKSYTDIQPEIAIKTRNGNCLPSFLQQCFTKGALDRILVEVFINRELPVFWQDFSLGHIRLLFPICRILFQWYCQNGETADYNPTITYKGKQYFIFEMVKNEDVPLLNEVLTLSKDNQRNYVLYCINFALQSLTAIKWSQVNEDYILWLSLLKLWFHEQENNGSSKKPVLFALIVSFLKHVLLDTYDREGKIKTSL